MKYFFDFFNIFSVYYYNPVDWHSYVYNMCLVAAMSFLLSYKYYRGQKDDSSDTTYWEHFITFCRLNQLLKLQRLDLTEVFSYNIIKLDLVGQ